MLSTQPLLPSPTDVLSYLSHFYGLQIDCLYFHFLPVVSFAHALLS